MKPQDFMEALGGVSQEKLEALAKWQEAKTPVTGNVPAKKDRFTQTAAEPVSAARRRETMKQNTHKRSAVTRLFPWNIGIGAAAVAAVVVAVSIGKEAIGQRNQMPVSMSGETSATEQVSLQEPNTEETNHVPVEMIERLQRIGGSDYVMMKVPQEGAVQVLRSVADAEACCQYTDETVVADQEFDFRRFLTEDVFAQYDVLYFAHKDIQQPFYLYGYDLAGGSIAADGTTLQLDFHALVYDSNYCPPDTMCSFDDFEPDWNTYYFYTVPKGSLPDLSAIEVLFEQYVIGEIPDDILKYANDTSDSGNAARLPEYVQTTRAYHDWEMSIPPQLYITWTDKAPVLPEDCVEAVSADAAQNPQYIAMMQEYYTQKSGIPCDFDFSGMGRDLDEIIETDDARFHIKGMAGCDWTMFVFFDVEPLNLSAEDTAYLSSMAFPNLSDNLCLNFGILDAEGKAVDFFQRITRTMPGQQSLDNGIFHCYCLISSHSAEAFTDGGKYLGIGKMNEPNEPEYAIRIPLDCLQTIPMQESELAETVSAFIPDESAHCYTPKPMKRCAVTPFGVYCVSDLFDSEHKTGWAQSCYWLEIPEYKLKATPAITQNNADGDVLSEIGLDGLTSWGSSIKEGTGVSFADFLFDRPYDVSKGTLTMLQPE